MHSRTPRASTTGVPQSPNTVLQEKDGVSRGSPA